jgi:transposase-like protein
MRVKEKPMRDFDITDAIFHDEEKARLFFEEQRWPHGVVVCPFCDSPEAVSALNGNSMGPGWYYCNACDQKKFTVRTHSVMERSHIPLAKWALGFRIMAASKKGISAKQLQRMLGLVSYKSAWFMAHRLRAAMTPDIKAGPLGGEGKVLESDQTFVGGKAKNAHKNKPIPPSARCMRL